MSQTISKSERTNRLLELLTGDAFDFFYETFAVDGALTTEDGGYATGKASFIKQFGCKSIPEEIISLALEAYLLSADLLFSLKEVHKLYEK